MSPINSQTIANENKIIYLCLGIRHIAYCSTYLYQADMLSKIISIIICIQARAKYIPSTSFWLCNIYSNYSTTTHQDGSSRKLGIYIGFEFPSIIKYLELLTGDICMARFANCQFDETSFPALGGEKKELEKQLKFHGIHHQFLILIIALINVNLKLRELFMGKVLQINCQMHLLIQRK